jgi:hypothetical protein
MIRAILLALVLTASASAQVLQPASPRHMTIDGRIYARTTDDDTLTLATIPARSAITGVYILPEDTLWMYSDSLVVSTNNVDVMAWHSEIAGVDDCLGCLAADWPQMPGDVLYSKSEQVIRARLVGIGADVRGTFRIIITYIELF